MAADLHALLCAAGIPPPYVLVGHSIGGVVARRFYAQHPGMVAGMLLVDSSHEQQASGSLRWAGGGVVSGMPGGGAASGPDTGHPPARWPQLGLVRGFDAEIAREAPPEYAGQIARSCCRRGSRRVAVREWLMMAL